MKNSGEHDFSLEGSVHSARFFIVSEVGLKQAHGSLLAPHTKTMLYASVEKVSNELRNWQRYKKNKRRPAKLNNKARSQGRGKAERLRRRRVSGVKAGRATRRMGD